MSDSDKLEALKQAIIAIIDRRSTIGGPNLEWVKGYAAGQKKQGDIIKQVMRKH